MNLNTTSKTAVAILTDNPRLAPCFAQCPSAALIPFMKSREAVYLLVSVVIKAPVEDFDTISYVCLESVRVLISSNILDDVSGLEIVPYAEENGHVQKLFR